MPAKLHKLTFSPMAFFGNKRKSHLALFAKENPCGDVMLAGGPPLGTSGEFLFDIALYFYKVTHDDNRR